MSIAARSAEERAGRLRGIGLMIVTGLCFSCLDVSAKYLVATYAALQIIFIRYLGHLVLTMAVAAPYGLHTLWRTGRPGLLLLRGAFLVGSTALNFFALQYLQLAETMSIFFATPFIVAVLAGPVLGEWIGPRRWAAVLFGFAGVIVVTRPGLGGMHWAAFLSMGAACCYACYALTTRMLATSDGNAAQQFYASALGTLVFLPFLPFVWTWPTDWLSIVAMVATGTFGFLGHGFLITAHRYAPAAVLSPFVYVQLIWMVTLGYLAFGDVPSGWTLAGAAIVVVSGLYLLLRERQLKGDDR